MQTTTRVPALDPGTYDAKAVTLDQLTEREAAVPATSAPMQMPELKVQMTEYDRLKARRGKLVDALKGQGGRQIQNALRSGSRVCFIGLADELLDAE